MSHRYTWLIGTAVVALATVAVSAREHRADTAAPAPLPSAPSICETPVSRTVALTYRVTGRARPLLVWTGRRDVGEAWFVSREAADGRRLELLIGTDPDRAPMRINRWGYVAETVCSEHAELIGLMTESGEQTIQQAQANATAPQHGQVFKAIRASTSSPGTIATETFTVSRPGQTTYRDLDGVLALLPTTGARREIVRPAGAESGFLTAVSGLIQDTVARRRDEGRFQRGLQRTYVYGGRLYDLALVASTVSESEGTVHIESEFRTLNRATGRTTDFRVTYLAEGRDAGTPVRIVYRPRWWLELELELQLQPAA